MRSILNPSSTEEIDSELKVCVYCGKPFYSNNDRALYCSDSCKSKMYQARKQSEKEDDSKYSPTSAETLPSRVENTLNSSESKNEDSDSQDLQEQLRLANARSRITAEEFEILVGILSDRFFAKIFRGEEMVVGFEYICNQCRPLADLLINDIGEVDASDSGFKTSNFTLSYILRGDDSDNSYIPGGTNKIEYLLTKNK